MSYSITIKHAIFKEVCCRYKQSQTAYRKRILYLKEIQNTSNTDRAEIMDKLGTFKIYFNSCGVRHQNRVFCLGQNIVFLKHEQFLDISAIDITKDSFSVNALRFILLYRSPS